ncbi:hypothetical protein [Nocardioides ochotonae]|uniref:hypothetical protein n=1 Tax=Nocardioides ochotonae TaxID=2685869 RepID=UPI001407F9B3|nr:hypothetical protein [Nocardioides ochotonae]
MDERQDESRTEDALRTPLTAVAAAARPTAAAGSVVRRGVRRRRRLRGAAVAAGAGAVVVGVALAATVLPSGPEGSGPSNPATAPADGAEGAAVFDCPLGHRVFRDPAPIPDLAEQERVVTEVRGLVRNVWTVRHAEPTALGVVALVQGNVGLAEQQLPEHRVALVAPWSQRLDVAAQVDRVLEQAILPVAGLVRRETDGLSGNAGVAVWKDAGAVVVSWRAPAPPEVQALAGEQAGGVRVIVDEVRWSGLDVHDASVTLWERAQRMPDVELTSTGACGDLSGMVVGVAAPLEETRRAELQQRFAEIAGMPVKVVEGDAVVGLYEGGDDLSE